MIYVHRSSRIISTVQFPTFGRCKHDMLQMWTSLETEVNKRGVCVSSAITCERVKITARRTPTTLPLLPLTRCSTAVYKNLNCISTDGQDMFCLFFCGQLNPFDIYSPHFLCERCIYVLILPCSPMFPQFLAIRFCNQHTVFIIYTASSMLRYHTIVFFSLLCSIPLLLFINVLFLQ